MNKFILLIAVALLSACSNSVNKDIKTIKLITPKPIQIPKRVDNSPVFVRTTHIRDEIINKKVSLNQQNVALIDAINLVMPNISVVAMDSDVLLNKKISVRSSQHPFGAYLKQLSNLSKYHITTDGKAVFVASSLSKSWDLSTLSMSSLSVSTQAPGPTIAQSDDAPKLVNNQESNDWQSITAQLKQMLGSNATVSGNERIGSIHASASPDKIKLADEWLKSIVSDLQKQVFFRVSIIETRADNADGSGIDFSLLSKGNLGDFGISNQAIESITDAGVISVGTLLKTPLILGDANLELILSFLAKQGKVKITNTPNILVSNGITSKLKTGSEFDYIASIESTTDQNGNVITTPVIQTKDIGLGLELTAKISQDNKLITVNVLPTITAIKSQSKIITNTGQAAQEVTLLDVALTALSTQVLIRPGQSILIGGLYVENIAELSKGVNNSILNKILGSEKSTNNKTEIIILLTSSEVLN